MDFDSTEFRPALGFAVLADAAQAVGGKLYVLGGGWDTLHVAQFPARHHSLAIGLRIRVPWTHTDRRLTLAIDLQDEDGRSLFAHGRLTHIFQVGRPPGLPEGSDIGVVRAFTFNNVPLPAPGGYAFVISVDEIEVDRLRFRARERQQIPT